MLYIHISKGIKQMILLFGDKEYIPVCRKCYEKLSSNKKQKEVKNDAKG